VELFLHSPSMPSWNGAQLKHRDVAFVTFKGSGTFSAIFFTFPLVNRWQHESAKLLLVLHNRLNRAKNVSTRAICNICFVYSNSFTKMLKKPFYMTHLSPQCCIVCQIHFGGADFRTEHKILAAAYRACA
jgi:hypothetical protein